MGFNQYKASRLRMLENDLESGRADEKIMPLIRLINSDPNLISTSSCSGRIVLLESPDNQDKSSTSFYRKWHRKVSVYEVKNCLPEKNSGLWFRTEPFILHISARDINCALDFMKKVRSCGVKRGGIQASGSHRTSIEIQGTGFMAFPISGDQDWDMIIPIANKLMEQNYSVLGKLESVFG
jgi:tRNA wybutosine-synthesizing protein 3